MTGKSLKLGKFMTNQVVNPFSRVRWPSVISTPEYDGIESGKSRDETCVSARIRIAY